MSPIFSDEHTGPMQNCNPPPSGNHIVLPPARMLAGPKRLANALCNQVQSPTGVKGGKPFPQQKNQGLGFVNTLRAKINPKWFNKARKDNRKYSMESEGSSYYFREGSSSVYEDEEAPAFVVLEGNFDNGSPWSRIPDDSIQCSLIQEEQVTEPTPESTRPGMASIDSVISEMYRTRTASTTQPISTVTKAEWRSDYQLVKNLSPGNQGRVDLYQHKPSGTAVIVKSIQPRMSGTPREVNINRWHLINHRSVVERFANFYDAETRTYNIAMEYCAGGDLHSFAHHWLSVRNEPIPEIFQLHFLASMGEALGWIHLGQSHVYPTGDLGMPEVSTDSRQKPLLHRDIKLDNLFLRWGPTNRFGLPDIVLGDFGGSALESSDYDASTAFGTEGYFPPEVADFINANDFAKRRRKLPVMTRASDMYTVGMCMYYLIAKEEFHSSIDLMSLWEKSSLRKWPLLYEFMSGCLHSDPSARPVAEYLFGLAPMLRNHIKLLYEHGVRMPVNSWPYPRPTQIPSFLESTNISADDGYPDYGDTWSGSFRRVPRESDEHYLHGRGMSLPSSSYMTSPHAPQRAGSKASSTKTTDSQHFAKIVEAFRAKANNLKTDVAQFFFPKPEKSPAASLGSDVFAPLRHHFRKRPYTHSCSLSVERANAEWEVYLADWKAKNRKTDRPAVPAGRDSEEWTAYLAWRTKHAETEEAPASSSITMEFSPPHSTESEHFAKIIDAFRESAKKIQNASNVPVNDSKDINSTSRVSNRLSGRSMSTIYVKPVAQDSQSAPIDKKMNKVSTSKLSRKFRPPESPTLLQLYKKFRLVPPTPVQSNEESESISPKAQPSPIQEQRSPSRLRRSREYSLPETPRLLALYKDHELAPRSPDNEAPRVIRRYDDVVKVVEPKPKAPAAEEIPTPTPPVAGAAVNVLDRFGLPKGLPPRFGVLERISPRFGLPELKKPPGLIGAFAPLRRLSQSGRRAAGSLARSYQAALVSKFPDDSV